MTKIMELFSQIDDLNKKIDDEPLNFRKRKIKLENEIIALDEKIRHAGLKSDFSSVSQYKSQKAIVLQKRAVDKTEDFKFEIETINKEIVNIIVDYYQEGKLIEDIIQIENIPNSISDEWFDLTNFGESTGYLFIDELDDDEFKWVYSNPINHVKFYSSSLDELKEQIKDKNEVLLIINNDLANQAEERDLIIYQESINMNLRDLDNSTSGDAQNIFDSLKSYEDTFSEAQIMYLCEIMGNNPKLSNYADDFNHILELNKDKIDEQLYFNTYQKIIDNLLESDNYNIFSDLREYADKFNGEQLTKLVDIFCNKDDISQYFKDLNYILSVNEGTINTKDVEERFQIIIDKYIDELNDDSRYYYQYSIFSDLKELANYFRDDQLIKLYHLMIDKDFISKFYDNFDYILKCSESKFDNINYEEICGVIIENGLTKLEDSTLYYTEVSDIFGYLEFYSILFSKNQLDKLYSLMIKKVIKGFIANNFHTIFEKNAEKFDLDTNQLYDSIIDNRIDFLKNLESKNDLDKYIMDDLDEFAYNFTKEQLNILTKVILENKNICNFAKDLMSILAENVDKLDELNINELYCDIIDSRITILAATNNSCIYKDLGAFSKFFSDDQIIALVNNIKDDNFAYYLNESIITLFEDNMSKFDEKIQNEIIEIIIDFRLHELEILHFDFKIAKKILGLMSKYAHKFTESQITKLCDISINNSQVYKCFICTDYLKFLLENNKEKIDKELYEQTLIKNNISIT